MERLTALPIQSFGVSSPQKEQTFCNNTSIMVEQPTVRAEVLVADGAPPPPDSPRPTLTQAILQGPESKPLLEQELDMLREEAESERKMRSDLEALHALCRPKEELLTKQYANCLQQLTLAQQENLTLRQSLLEPQPSNHNLALCDVEDVSIMPAMTPAHSQQEAAP